MSFGDFRQTAGDTWAAEAFGKTMDVYERAGTEMVPIKTENDARIGARGTHEGIVEMNETQVVNMRTLGTEGEGMEMTPLKRSLAIDQSIEPIDYRAEFPDSDDEEPSFEESESELTESEPSFEASRMEGQVERAPTGIARGGGGVQEPMHGVGYNPDPNQWDYVERNPFAEEEAEVPMQRRVVQLDEPAIEPYKVAGEAGAVQERPGLAARALESLKRLISGKKKYLLETDDLNQYLLANEGTEMADLSKDPELGGYEPPEMPTNPEHGTEMVDLASDRYKPLVGDLEAPKQAELGDTGRRVGSRIGDNMQIADRPSQSEMSGAMPDDAMQGLKGLIKGAQDRGMSNRAIAEEFHIGMGASKAQASAAATAATAATADVEMWMSRSAVRNYMLKQGKGLLMTPLVVPLILWLNDADEGLGDAVSAGMVGLDLIATGDPLGAVIWGAGQFWDAENESRQKVIDNDTPDQDYGARLGYVREGDKWYPAI